MLLHELMVHLLHDICELYIVGIIEVILVGCIIDDDDIIAFNLTEGLDTDQQKLRRNINCDTCALYL